MSLSHNQIQASPIKPSKGSKFLLKFMFPTFRENKKQRKMLSTKKLIKMARRWQKFAAMQRKRISFPRSARDADSCSTSSSSTVERGHFVVYRTDQRRFVIPLAYLDNEVIRQLLNMSEEEFGMPSSGLITLPCDSVFMAYIISLIKKGILAGDLHKALLL